MGADQAESFHRWREPHAILALAAPVVMVRAPHQDREELMTALRAGGKWSAEELKLWEAGIATTRMMPVSATDVRELVRLGDWDAAGHDLSRPVLEFIRDYGLYVRGELGAGGDGQAGRPEA
jgi:nicotinic acid mononucleotide adenylyltransferase